MSVTQLKAQAAAPFVSPGIVVRLDYQINSVGDGPEEVSKKLQKPDHSYVQSVNRVKQNRFRQ